MVAILFKHVNSIKISVISYISVMGFLCLANLINPYLSGQFVDKLAGNNTGYLLSTLFLSIIMINIVQIILRYCQTLLSASINNDLMHSLSNEIFQKIFRSESSQFCNIDKAYLIDQIYKDCQMIIQFLTSSVTNFIFNITTFLTCLYILFQIDIFLCLILSSTIPIYIVTFNSNKKRIQLAHKLSTEKNNKYFSRFAEQINQLSFIKRNAIDAQMEARLTNSFREKKQATINAIKVEYFFNNINQIIIIFAYMCIIGIGGHKVIQGSLSIGKFTIINTYFTMLIRSISFFLGISGSFQAVKVSVQRVHSLLSVPEEKTGPLVIERINRIKVNNLSIHYHDYTVLNNCNYEFIVGNIYGIKGFNGGGKTTFLNALMGIFNGQYTGNIQYNNYNITDLNMRQIRHDKISYLEQDPTFLNMDVSNFLMLGINGKPVDLSFLSKISKEWKIEASLNKEISENGSNFSGGEQQKIAMARIFRKEADVILLDEPTSALDKESSKKLMDLLDNLKQSAIIVMVSHDLYALDRCDIIINIDDIQNS